MQNKKINKIRRHRRIRAKVSGTSSRPRLSVFRSHQHIHLQLIDDSAQKTLVQASTQETASVKGKKGQAAAVAKLLAERALKLNIKEAVFDRGGFKYHGRVRFVAEAAREAGLKL